MNKLRFWVVFYCCIAAPVLVSGQSNDVYPDMYGGWFINPVQVSPSLFPEKAKTDFLISYKSKTGAFGKVATFSFAVSHVVQPDKKTNHLLRAYFFNEKEGPYIHKPRAAVNYAYRLSLAEDVFLSAGMTLGFVQTAFTAPSATASGSTTSPDGSIGMHFQWRSLQAGFASCQLFNAESNPLVAAITYRRYYNAFARYDIKLNAYWTIQSYIQWRMMQNRSDYIDVAALVNYRDVFSIGADYRYQNSLNFIISTKLHMGNDILLLSFVYNSAFFSRVPAWTDSAEMHGQYSFY